MIRLLLVVCSSAAAVAGMAGPAAAATVTMAGGQVTYQAAPREVNAVRMETGLAPVFPFLEYRATLQAGPGCTGTFPVVCGDGQTGAAPFVYLGDRNDVAYIDSFSGSPRVFGESGDDDIWSGGNVETWAYGGPGNDTLRLNTDGGGMGFGGPGDDRIGSNGSQQDDLQGEAGDDLLASRARGAQLTGASGRDQLVALEGSLLIGDSGADVLVAPNGHHLLGGAGTDVIKGHGVVDAGSGADLIDVTDEQEGMAPDDVTCGSGFDTVWAGPDDVVAADCELRLRGAAPPLPGVAAARSAADALWAHVPDPAAA